MNGIGHGVELKQFAQDGVARAPGLSGSGRDRVCGNRELSVSFATSKVACSEELRAEPGWEPSPGMHQPVVGALAQTPQHTAHDDGYHQQDDEQTV